MRRLSAVALLGLGCASPGMPPGGPPDIAAPQVLAIVPDSGRTGVTPKEVIFRFDEVVSERPPSVTALEDLFIISPRDGTPNVSWHRDEISVRPRRGWRPNTAYTVIMQRGLADIRGNVRNAGASTFFSTGGNIPRTRISGHVFDWLSGAPAVGALVESFLPADTLHAYVALVDSSGAFTLERLPAGRYVLRAFVDRNKNRGLDEGESWDSVAINLSDSLASELLVFVHDTVPPRLKDVAALDSLSLTVTFDRPVDPAQNLTVANFSVVGSDSVAIPIRSAGRMPIDTMPSARPPVPTTSITRPPAAARPDTVAGSRPRMSRPAPPVSAVIRLARQLEPRKTYRVRAIGIRGLLGHTGDSERSYTAPAPAPAARPDSVRPTPPPVRR